MSSASVRGGGGHLFGENTFVNSTVQQGDRYYTITGDPEKTLQQKADACRNALFLTDPIVDRDTLKDTKGQRAAGTCEWIRKNESYRSWLHGDSQCLWITGGPGKGKTMLSIFLTEELEEHIKELEDTELLFYFCRCQDEKLNNTVAILRGLAYQLVDKRRGLAEHISSYFESPEKTKMTLSSAQALWIILERLLRAPGLGTVFCVLDGLDECDDAGLLADKFRRFFSTQSSRPNGGQFKLAIVSRKIDGLDGFPQVKLDPDNDEYVNDDIRQCISTSVLNLSRLPGFNDDVRAIVEDALLSRAEGTFLWVGFVMHELSKKKTCTEIVEALNDFPRGLPAIYSRMLQQIQGSRRAIASEILCWVTMAVRPLTLHELTAATAISSTAPISSDRAIRDYITMCGPILKIIHLNKDSSEDGSIKGVSLVHQSARDYFLRKEPDEDPILETFRINAEETHAKMLRKCLDCIEKSDLRHAPLNTNPPSFLGKSPLLNYAALYWLEHARLASTYADQELNLSRPFFQKNSIIRTNWWEDYRDVARERVVPKLPKLPLLHIACLCGIDSLARKLLTEKAQLFSFRKPVDKKDSDGHTPLFYAVLRDHSAVIQLLLDHSADVNVRSRKSGFTALHYAALGGHEAIVQLLLDHRAGINEKDNVGFTALHNAALRGHEAVVRLLLDHRASINEKDNVGCTALHNAAWVGHEAVVRLLLDHRAGINEKDNIGFTALHNAAWVGHEAVVQLLLDHRASINEKDNMGCTALYYAACKGHEAIMQLLKCNSAS